MLRPARRCAETRRRGRPAQVLAGPRCSMIRPILLADNGVGQVVWDKVAAIEDTLEFESKGRSGRDFRAEEVTGRDLGEFEFRSEKRCLGALAGPLRPHQDDMHGTILVWPTTAPRHRTDSPGHRSVDEAFVVAHHQLRFELPHGVDRDTDHDQHRGCAELERVDAGDLASRSTEGWR